jgi:hypothetical protein
VAAREGGLQGQKIFKNDHKKKIEIFVDEKSFCKFFSDFWRHFMSLQNFF